MPATLTLTHSSATGGWWVGRKRCPLSAIKPTLAIAAAQQLRLQRGLHEFGYFTSCPDSGQSHLIFPPRERQKYTEAKSYIYIYIYIYIYVATLACHLD